MASYLAEEAEVVTSEIDTPEETGNVLFAGIDDWPDDIFDSDESDDDDDDFMDDELCTAVEEEVSCTFSNVETSRNTDAGIPVVLSGEWTNVDDHDPGPYYHGFTPRNQCGPNNIDHLNNASPGEFFKLFFTEELVDHITTETNKYAVEKLASIESSPHSRMEKWKATTTSELYILIGLLLNMGLVRLPALHLYWSKQDSCHVPYFAAAMSRNRFQLIYHTMLHCCTSDEQNRVRGDKIDPLVKRLVEKFQKHFCPSQNVSADETMIGYKGQVAFKRYMPKKPVKWGLLARTVADATTGYIFNVKVDYGGKSSDFNDVPPGITKTSNCVLQLMENHLDCGYHVFADRLYSSVALAKELHERKTYFTGTVMANRKGLPNEVKSKLKKGEKFSFRNGQLMALVWHNKRQITMLSTFCRGDEYVEKRMRGTLGSIKLPICVDMYNTYMGGVDLADQYYSYYSFARKSIKWWKKIFFWLIETSLNNSYIIYKMTGQGKKNISLLQYRQKVVEDLVYHGKLQHCIQSPSKLQRSEVGTSSPHAKKRIKFVSRLDGKFHCQEKRSRLRRCKVCNKNSKERKETTYVCSTCNDEPSLHPGDCFTRYHTLEQYK